MTAPKWLTHPTGLSSAAQAHWHRYAPQLVADGLITADSAELLRQLCRLLAIVEAAEADVAENGITLLTAGGSRKPNAAVGVLLRAQQAAGPLLARFGLDG